MNTECSAAGMYQLAALYALGALDGEEAQVFETHLGEGCPVCTSEVRVFEATAQQIPFGLSLASPSPQVRERLFSRIEAEASGHMAERGVQVWKAWRPTQDQPRWVVRSSEGDWQETSATGVLAKNLFVDVERQSVTMLVRMEPGAQYPGHRHADTEQCYVVQGDLRMGDQVYRAGDFIRASAGSVDDVQYTEGGCLLFIVSSQHDELLESRLF